MTLINFEKPTFVYDLVGELYFCYEHVLLENKQFMFSWFELQSSMVSPFSAHQQQLMMLAQQQSLLMAAAVKSAGGDSKVLAAVQQPASNGSINLPTQSWGNTGHQMPGMVMPHELKTFMQG